MSMNPGATMRPVASMMCSAFSGSCGAMATIVSAAMATSVVSRGAAEPSITVPFWMSSDQDPVCPSHSAGAWSRVHFREMRVHDPPLPGFLLEHHRRPRDKFVALIMNFAWRTIGADPATMGIAVTPDYGHFIGNDAADVERRPVGPLNVLLIEGPQATPMVRTLIRMTIEIVEGGLRQRAPDRLQFVPVKMRVGQNVFVKQLQQPLPIAL